MKNDHNATFSLANVSRHSLPLLCIGEAASDAPEAAHQRCGCQLACANAARETKLLVSQVATKCPARSGAVSESAVVMMMVSCTYPFM